MISILIASDIRLYSEGIRECLRERGPFVVVGTATRAAEALILARELSPMVVLLDQAMAESLNTLRFIRRGLSDTSIIALGVPDQEDKLLEWAEAGITGFVPREASVEELASTIESAVRGELLCSPRLAGTLLRRLAWRTAVGGAPIPRSPLTAREAEIVRLIDLGLSNKEIAARLGIEVATVKNHVHNLLEKLHVHRRAEAAARLRGRDPRRPTPWSGLPAIND